jgi:CRISPR-associated protein Cas2
MYVLITYDVASGGSAGARRLRRVAKICTSYGQRVQFSVFECLVDPAQYETLKHELSEVVDESRDSLRLYNLGKRWQNRVEHIGAKQPYNPEGALVI